MKIELTLTELEQLMDRFHRKADEKSCPENLNEEKKQYKENLTDFLNDDYLTFFDPCNINKYETFERNITGSSYIVFDPSVIQSTLLYIGNEYPNDKLIHCFPDNSYCFRVNRASLGTYPIAEPDWILKGRSTNAKPATQA